MRPDQSGDYATIQDVVNAAAPGDTVLLTSGTFTGIGNRDMDFGGKDLVVRSEHGDRALCFIGCGGSQGEPHRGFDFHNGETVASVIEGVTITSGYAYNATTGLDGGGGVRCKGASPRLVNRVISNCRADSSASPMGVGST